MPGKKKGKAHKKPAGERRALELPADDQTYAKVTKLLGNCRVLVTLPDKKEVMVHIPGKFRKKCWITSGDVIIVSLRSELAGEKGDMLYKYDKEEVRTLSKSGYIPNFFVDDCLVTEIDDGIEWIRTEDRSNNDSESEKSDISDI